MLEIKRGLVEDAYDAEKFRTDGHALIDLLADYLKKLDAGAEDKPVMPAFSPEEAYSRWELPAVK